MEREKLLEITNDVTNKSNKDLLVVINALTEEHEKTKNIIIDLTNHLDKIESLYQKVNKEIEKSSQLQRKC